MTTPNDENKNDTVPFYPHHVRIEFYVVIGILVLALVVGVLGMLYPVGLQAPADPLNTPLHVKPEWYFLGLYQVLKLVPPTILGINGPMFAVVVILLAVVALILWPFLDQKQDSRKAMRLRWIFTIAALLILVALTIWGEVS